MRKLAIAGAVAAAALSWAGGARAADDAAKERREAADATKAEARQEGREARQEAREAGREVRQETREGTQSAREGARAAATDEKKHPLFSGKNNFDVEGKVQKVSGNSLTLQRDELPAATLHVSKNTKIEVDGEAASMQQLKPGQDVKASFNLMGDKVEAVEIKADKMDADKERENRREMQKQQQENRREMQQKR